MQNERYKKLENVKGVYRMQNNQNNLNIKHLKSLEVFIYKMIQISTNLH